MKIQYLSLCLLLTLCACAQESAESYGPAADQAVAVSDESEEALQALGYDGGGDASPAREGGAPSTPQSPGDGDVPAQRGRKLIRDVSLSLRVEDTQAASAALTELADGLGGFVASLDAHRYNDLFHYSMVLRVPSGRLDTAVQRAKEMAAEVDREHRGVQDVTDRYVDLEARQRTLEATETELQALLAEARQRNFDAEQVMAVYERLIQIRTQIEQIQGQLKVLEDQTSLGTLRIELSPTEAAKPVVAEGWRPGDTAKRALRGLVAALRFLGDLLIVVLIQFVPILLLVGLPLWALVRWWRRKHPPKVRHAEGGETPPPEPRP
jgi:hypothetical protein